MKILVDHHMDYEKYTILIPTFARPLARWNGITHLGRAVGRSRPLCGLS